MRSILLLIGGLARIGKTCGGDNADRKSSGPETESVVRTTLDKDKVEIQKEKLDVYRSAMRSYIENSNIYKPFLNSVVDEYETFCRVQQERISDLEGLRAEIVAIQDDNKKEYYGVRDEA